MCLSAAYVFVYLVYTIYILKFWIIAIKVDYQLDANVLKSPSRHELMIKSAYYFLIALCVLGGGIFFYLLRIDLSNRLFSKNESILLGLEVSLQIVSNAQGLILLALYIYAICLFSKFKKSE